MPLQFSGTYGSLLAPFGTGAMIAFNQTVGKILAPNPVL